MADTSEKTLADELRAAASRVREHLVPAVKAWVLPQSALVVLCGSHEAAEEMCRNCLHFSARDRVLARLVAALINAREPLASWLSEVADEAERHEAQGMGNAQDEIVSGPCLAVARVLNGTAS